MVLFTPNMSIGILILRCHMQVGSMMGDSAGICGRWIMSHPSGISVPLCLKVVLGCLTSKQTRQRWGNGPAFVLDYLITGWGHPRSSIVNLQLQLHVWTVDTVRSFIGIERQFCVAVPRLVVGWSARILRELGQSLKNPSYATFMCRSSCSKSPPCRGPASLSRTRCQYHQIPSTSAVSGIAATKYTQM